MLELASRGVAPAAMIVRSADPLLVSGAVGAEIWYGCGIPIIEYAGDDFYEAVRDGAKVTAAADTGKIVMQD